jgi:hypothetical protein
MLPEPSEPPTRPNAAAFHYHAYSYPGDLVNGPFKLSYAMLSAGEARFYSLYQDLRGLWAWGTAAGVPNLKLTLMSTVAGGSQTLGGRETLMLSFGGPPGPGAANAPAVVFTGGIHAREWIAPEITYLIAEYLIKHYSTAPQGHYQTTIRNLVDSRRIYIIPMLNPDGNMYTVFTPAEAGRLWRKNRRDLPVTASGWVDLLTDFGRLGPNPPPFTNVRVPGTAGAAAKYQVPVFEVPLGTPLAASPRYDCPLAADQIGIDLNRNLRTRAWGYDGLSYPPGRDPEIGETGDPAGDNYFGPAAGSERETANLQVALTSVGLGLVASIDYHSRGQFILFPSEKYYYDGGMAYDYQMLGGVLQSLVHGPGTFDYRLGTPRDVLHGDATGTVMDHAAQAHLSRAFTIELDPTQDDWFAWQLPEDYICGVFEKNIRGALAALAAPLNPHNDVATRRAYQQILDEFTPWAVYGRGNQLPV